MARQTPCSGTEGPTEPESFAEVGSQKLEAFILRILQVMPRLFSTRLGQYLRARASRDLASIGTMCSGTESPWLGYTAMRCAFTKFFGEDVWPATFEFASDTDRSVQGLLDTMVNPKFLFGDCTELHTGEALEVRQDRLKKVPVVSMFIAGYPCPDVSRLVSNVRDRRQQVMAGKPITVTDPSMTRFMMTLEDAVDLVLYAFQNGRNGDIFVQKSPAATVEVLAHAILELLGKPQYPVHEIGTRHGEKLYETLLGREEMACAEDMGDYFRVPPDARDLNYAKFVDEGERRITQSTHGEDYNSHNTTRLDVAGMKSLLLKLDFMKRIVNGEAAVTEY